MGDLGPRLQQCVLGMRMDEAKLIILSGGVKSFISYGLRELRGEVSQRQGWFGF